jgi:hypothetical protein
MVDGKFYDAGAYKASPVPFALWSETVYEGEKSGVAQGLFTVTGAARTASNNWLAEGKWLPAGSEPKPRPKETKPKLDDEDEGPPKLRRPGSSDNADKQPSPEHAPTPEKKPAPEAKPGDSSPTSAPSQSSIEEAPEAAAKTTANDEDPNRPVLKRGQAETLGNEHPQVGASTGMPRRPVSGAGKAEGKKVSTQSIPAISDAAGPDLRPYLYDLQPDEEQKYRKGMLAMAWDALLAQVKLTTPPSAVGKPGPRTTKTTRPAKASQQPTFDDVQFHAFDLWNTNEPVFVLSATAHLPKGGNAEEVPYYITLVAKKNIYDELHKLYAGVTDPMHLDQTPRFELIDAVDADGDGRGELLFRRLTTGGTAFGVYRAGPDQLVPLFEGTPAGQ